ncbi:type II secretion system protein [Sorangium sp. So ce1036]|uniref:type IV pilin protein n=1 Tax=Sorangium sp. So ce1036 TaxID=3133328 RepID=UPI003F0E5CE5
MSRTTAIRGRAFTLVELMIVVAIVGVLAALGVAGVRGYLATAKTAEAKQTVGAIARAAVTQYERERGVPELQPSNSAPATPSRVLCASATPVPSDFASVQGTKYQPSAEPGDDFMTGTNLAGWQCLGFSIAHPIYFQYSYLVGGDYVSQDMPGSPLPGGPEGFEAAARGDLDGDGQTCTVVRTGEVFGGQLVTSTLIYTNGDPD